MAIEANANANRLREVNIHQNGAVINQLINGGRVEGMTVNLYSTFLFTVHATV